MYRDHNRIITFQRILDYAADNKNIYKDLKDLIKAEANCIVLFVGAGLSNPVYKLWRSSLETIAQKFHSPEKRKTCNDLLDEGRFKIRPYKVESAAVFAKRLVDLVSK